MKGNNMDDQLLVKLRNRSDLDPDPVFIKELRLHLKNEASTNKRFYIPKIGMVLTVCLSILIIFILSTTYLNDSQQAVNTDVAFNKIISSNPAFHEIYDKVAGATDMPEQSKKLVYYLEGIRTNNEEYIRSAVGDPADGAQLHKVKEFYHNVDFSTMKLESISPPSKEKRIEIVLSISRGEIEQSKILFLNIKEKDDVRIDDPVAMVEWNGNKDTLIAEKVGKLRSKIELGITKAEAVELFGKDYKEYVNSDAEDGTVEDWEYVYFVEDGTEILDVVGAIDIGNIQNQNIGIQFTIGWSSEGKAQRLIMFYGQSGKVYAKGINQNGVIDERIN